MIRFIVNPVSGSGKGLKVWKKVERYVQLNRIPYDVFFTEEAKHATELAKEMAQDGKSDVIVAVGGDGTVHEIANGLVDSQVSLGYIPAGSGNDFAKGMGIPKDYKKALKRILANQKRTVDIIDVNDEIVVNVLGVGFDSQVAHYTNQSKHKKWLNHMRLGKFSYVLSVVKILFTYQPTEIRLMISGDEEKTFYRVWLIAVANIPFYGGGLRICPDAKCDDGVLNLCVISNISRFHLLCLLPKVFFGKHVHHPSISSLSGEQVDISSKTPLLIHGDGELLGKTPIQIRVKHKALHIV